VRLFSDIEKTIERGFRKWTERVFGPAQSDELLLVHRGILEEIEGKVQTVARGRRLFPFGRLVVTLARPMRTAVPSMEQHSPREAASKPTSAKRSKRPAASWLVLSPWK
jgi:hypothetical protein